jgi:tRNA threonylcarbamoyladenosine biosynthesis protein TsaE
MNTEQKLRLTTKSSEESLALGQKVAKHLSPGQLIEFIGDLGGGKTTMIKGIAKGLGIKTTVTSPTFNIHRSYMGEDNLIFDHFDLYRLDDDAIITQTLNENISSKSSVVAIEWADNFTHLLDKDRLIIKMHFTDENARTIEIEAKGDKSNKLLKKLKNDISNQN